MLAIFKVIEDLKGEYLKELFDSRAAQLSISPITLPQFIVYVGQYEVAKAIQPNLTPANILGTLSAADQAMGGKQPAEPMKCGNCGGGKLL